MSSPFTARDARFMARALRLAERGRYTSSPNPRVGCVITKGEQILGQGFTQQVGSQHAEIEAIDNARRLGASDADFAASTFYVTLEPCSHTGRTPPCCDALIMLSPQRVVIAMQDPNPLVGSNGIQQMIAAGIQVECGLLEEEAVALNPGFISRMTRQLPWVRLKVAASLDGKMIDAASERMARNVLVVAEAIAAQ